MAAKKKLAKARPAKPKQRARAAITPARAAKILDILETTHPEAECALHYKDAFQLVVATILSAQCTDLRVNLVTPALFARYAPKVRKLEKSLGK